MRYGEAFKQRMVDKVLRAGGPGTAHVAREARVREETLSRWVADARRISDMSNRNPPGTGGSVSGPAERGMKPERGLRLVRHQDFVQFEGWVLTESGEKNWRSTDGS